MKFFIAAIFASTFVLLPAALVAQQQRGDIEAQLTGFYVSTVGTEASFGMGSVQAKLGYYFADWFEMGLGPTWTITTLKSTSFNPQTFQLEDKSVTQGDIGTTVFMQVSFLSDSKTVPYFGGQYYKQSFRDDQDKGSMGIDGGVKFFFTRKAAFDLSGNYLFSLNPDAEGGVLMFGFGLSILI